MLKKLRAALPAASHRASVSAGAAAAAASVQAAEARSHFEEGQPNCQQLCAHLRSFQCDLSVSTSCGSFLWVS